MIIYKAKNKAKKSCMLTITVLAFMIVPIMLSSCTSLGGSSRSDTYIPLKPQVVFRQGDEVKKNSRLPTFIAPTITGEVVNTSKYDTNIFLLNFWSIRCGPCIKEIPYLEKLFQEFKGNGLKIISVNTDQASTEDVFRFIENKGFDLNYDILTDPDLVLSSVFTKWFVPVTILIDSNGVMRYNHTGFTSRDYEKYRKLIKALIKERG